jgi:glycosyltransferase domain-containing protein
MSLLNKLTVIIPTYNRQEYAIRTMNYYSGQGMIVHVLDGTENAIDKNLICNLESNINYHHLPISINERFKIASEITNTDYTLMNGDDEFFLFSGLKECIKVLEEEDIVSCIGRSLFFNINQNIITAEALNPESGSPWHPGYQNYSILEEDYANRIIKHMNPYLSIACYAVTRTSVWKTNLFAASVCKSSTTDSEELALEMASAFQGKSKVINHLMWLRSGENSPFQFAVPGKYLSFGNWFESNKYKKEVNLYINNLSTVLENLDKSISKEEISRIIIKGCEAFALFEHTRRFNLVRWLQNNTVNLINYFTPFTFLNQFRVFKLIRQFHHNSSSISLVAFKFYLKKYIYTLLKKLKIINSEEYYFKKYDSTLFGRASAWKDAGIGVDLDEIKSVSDLITNFHKDLNKAI